MIDPAQIPQMREEIYDHDTLAKLVVDHITNDKGEILARVWENSGFQEIYDYKGVLRQRHKLKRKQEQIYNQLDSSSKLFQKTYYCPQLLLDDEQTLRSAFTRCNDNHESTVKAI